MKQIYLINSIRAIRNLSSGKIHKTLWSILFLLFFSTSFCQSGAMKGKVYDKDTKDPIPFANIVLYIDSTIKAGATSDFDGNFIIKPITPGTYDVKTTYIGYKTAITKGIIINADQIRFYDIAMEPTTLMLDECVVSEYRIPLISKDETVSGGHVTAQEIQKMPNRSANAVATTVGGVFSADGERGNIRGCRSGQTIMYIDGIRVSGSSSLSQWNIDNSDIKAPEKPKEVEIKPEIRNDGPQSGLLTAGEIHDFSKWYLWKDISEYQLESYRGIWDIYPEKRFSVQVLSKNNFPVVDCEVLLMDNNNNIIWRAKSDNTGKAELWAGMFEKASDKKTTYKIIVKSDGISKEIKKPRTFHQGINTIRLKKNCESIQNVDILFTVDATGSMSDEIRYLKVELKDIIQKFSAQNPDLNIRLGSAFYRCFGNTYVTKESGLSNNIEEGIAFINEQDAGEGGIEAVEEALRVSAEEMQWSEQARTRLMFLVLDEPPGSSPEINEKIQKAVSNAASKGIRIIPIVASGTGRNSDKSLEYLMRSIALASNGTYVFLTDDSGIGGSHTEPSIDDYDVELLNDLILRLLKQFTFVEDCNKVALVEEKPENISTEIAETEDELVTWNESQDSQKDKFLNEGENPEGKIWIKAYPNPSHGLVYIESGKKTREIFLIDLSGKIIMRIPSRDKDKIILELYDLPNGMYFLKYANVDHWDYVKIMLNH
jgi:hypothetical protein